MIEGSLCARNNYAAARLQGLEADLGLTGDQYQTALSILFVGYDNLNPSSTTLALTKMKLYLDASTQQHHT